MIKINDTFSLRLLLAVAYNNVLHLIYLFLSLLGIVIDIFPVAFSVIRVVTTKELCLCRSVDIYVSSRDHLLFQIVQIIMKISSKTSCVYLLEKIVNLPYQQGT